MSKPLPSHISQQFNRELEDVHARLLVMGGLVEEQLDRVLRALVQGDAGLAETVVFDDARVNRLELVIEEDCTEIIARRQPAANDLRLILVVVRTVTDMERIGDEVSKIGRMVVRLAQTVGAQHASPGVVDMGRRVARQLHVALDCLARMDAETARTVAARDVEIDRDNDLLLAELAEAMRREAASVPSLLNVMWIVRALERIGDHARNVCENVVYLVEGRTMRHAHDQRRPEGAALN